MSTYPVRLTADQYGNVMSALEDYIGILEIGEDTDPDELESLRSAYATVSQAAREFLASAEDRS